MVYVQKVLNHAPLGPLLGPGTFSNVLIIESAVWALLGQGLLLKLISGNCCLQTPCSRWNGLCLVLLF